jgi:hypothetical protein
MRNSKYFGPEIKLNDKYTTKRDHYCWHLMEWKDVVSKKDKVKRRAVTRTTYHCTLLQVCSEMIDRELGDCDSLQEIRDMLQTSAERLADFHANKENL